MPLALISQNKQYFVEGKIETTNNEAQAMLICRTNTININKTVNIIDGKFEFKGNVINEIEEPVKATIFLKKNKNTFVNRKESLTFYLEPGINKIVSKTNSITNAKVLDSKINSEYNRLLQALEPLDKKEDDLKSEYKKKAAKNIKDTLALAKIDVQLDSLEKEQKNKYLHFVKENPDSFISILALNKYDLTPLYSDVAPFFNLLSERVKNTKSGKEYAVNLERIKTTSVGKLAPNFTQKDVNGNDVKLSDYKGKYVFVDFWASWCGPCRQENPNVLKAYKKYHSKGFDVLGVSLDVEQMKDNWLNAIKEDNLPWVQVSDLKMNNKAAELYGIKAIPQNILIDPKGVIIAKNLKGKELHLKLAEIFK